MKNIIHLQTTAGPLSYAEGCERLAAAALDILETQGVTVVTAIHEFH